MPMVSGTELQLQEAIPYSIFHISNSSTNTSTVSGTELFVNAGSRFKKKAPVIALVRHSSKSDGGRRPVITPLARLA